MAPPGPRYASVPGGAINANPPPDPHPNELKTTMPVLPDGQEHLRHGYVDKASP